MDPEMREQELLAEIQRMKSDLRRLKGLGACSIAVLALLVLGLRIHDHHKLAADEIVAQDFVLHDPNGNVRGRMSIFPEGSGVELYATSGERRAQLVAGPESATLNLYVPVTAEKEAASVNLLYNDRQMSSFRMDPDGSQLEMHSKETNGTAILGLRGSTATMMLSGADQNVPKIWLTADQYRACTSLGGVADQQASSSLCLHSPGLPTLELADQVGNRTVIGVPQNPDLATSESSAASVILKHKNGKKVQMTPK